MRFDVPAGHGLVFQAPDGAPLDTPRVVLLDRTIEVAASDA